MVVVLGGVGNLAGAIVGGMGLGLVNKLLEPVAGAVLSWENRCVDLYRIIYPTTPAGTLCTQGSDGGGIKWQIHPWSGLKHAPCVNNLGRRKLHGLGDRSVTTAFSTRMVMGWTACCCYASDDPSPQSISHE